MKDIFLFLQQNNINFIQNANLSKLTFNYTLYLDFAPEDQAKASLSSSFGKCEWSDNTNYTDMYSFLLNYEPSAVRRLHRLSSLLDCKVFRHNRITELFFNCPRNWLTRIRNAKYVVTDSYHGSVTNTCISLRR